MPDPALADQLVADRVLRRVGGELRTARRWQAAMMRAAVRLQAAGDPGTDLRVPVAAAVLELYDGLLPEPSIVDAVDLLTAIESRELSPRRMDGRIGPDR